MGEETLLFWPGHEPDFPPGLVWLAGAGPGDPGLLTLHGLNALRQADVVVYDALVDKRIIGMARTGAETLDAGKRGGCPSPKQEDISQRLIVLAQAGKRVLRLKGGDPFVFGRGGEEVLTLAKAGVPFRVTPGITAGMGGLAAAGIPATHRDTNSTLTFITGHAASGRVPQNLNWMALAQGSPVLVFYMALKHAAEIQRCLLEAGREEGEPTTLIGHATTPQQRILDCTLGALAEAAQRMDPPALIVVGPVVGMRLDLLQLGAAVATGEKI